MTNTDERQKNNIKKSNYRNEQFVGEDMEVKHEILTILKRNRRC